MNSDMVQYKRSLDLSHVPHGQSLFLWGARKTGKSMYLKHFFPDSLYIDLLKTDVYLRYLKQSHLLRQELLAMPKKSSNKAIIIDEVQKIPGLLDEVHYLIENHNMAFILCGSSARKLKRGQANLLGGRAWKYDMLPLTFNEVPDFDLLKAMNQGLLPDHYNSLYPDKDLQAYVETYLKEEIQAEGLTRNLRAFSQFLDSVIYSNAELVQYKNIAQDCGVDSKTIKAYYQILIDTHLGYFLKPYPYSKGRQTLRATPKFYMFDLGVSTYLSKQNIQTLSGPIAGQRFEQLMYLELRAYLKYKEKREDVFYWRSKTGLEVDFIIHPQEIAIECKIGRSVKLNELKGTKAFLKDHAKCKQAYVVCTEPVARKIQISDEQSIDILPWNDFLIRLWQGKIF